MSSPMVPDRLRRRLLIAGAALPAACTSPAPQLAPPAVSPTVTPVRVGQRWHYERINVYRGEPVGELFAEVVQAEDGPTAPAAGAPITRGMSAPLVVALRDARGPIGEELYLRPWDVIRELTYDAPQTYEAAMPLLPERLEPGAGRRETTRYSVPGSSSRLYWQQSMRATGWERIVVPAGTFDALRVERYVNFRHWDIWREHPWRLDVLWYSPEAGRWVQRDWTGQYRWPSRRPVEAEEDRVRWRLLGWQA